MLAACLGDGRCRQANGLVPRRWYTAVGEGNADDAHDAIPLRCRARMAPFNVRRSYVSDLLQQHAQNAVSRRRGQANQCCTSRVPQCTPRRGAICCCGRWIGIAEARSWGAGRWAQSAGRRAEVERGTALHAHPVCRADGTKRDRCRRNSERVSAGSRVVPSAGRQALCFSGPDRAFPEPFATLPPNFSSL